MKREAEENAEVDRKTKEEADLINAADSLIFTTEKQLKEYGDKLSAPNKEAIEAALAKLKEAHTAKNFEELATAQEALNAAWTAASQEMYAAGAESEGGEATQSSDANASDGGAEDVSFEEVK